MIAALAIACIALGHLIRDGWPPLGSTHLARFAGGAWCVLGAALIVPEWEGIALGLAIYIGFYTDMLHGEGHRARGWIDVPPLLVSGVTSLLPLAIVAQTRTWDLARGEIVLDLVVLAVSLLKPAIWFVAWRGVPEHRAAPTRVAATAFGVVVGCAVLAGLDLRGV